MIRILRTRSVVNRAYSITSPTLAKILASDSIEPVCAKVFKDRGHELVELPGIKKEELLKEFKAPSSQPYL